MEDYFLNPAEEVIVDNLRSTFYSSDFRVDSTTGVLSGVISERRAIVLQTAFEEVSAEQAQRSRYIALTIFPDGKTDSNSYETLANGLFEYYNNSRLDELGRTIGVAINQPAITAEVLEQARIYSVVDNNLTKLASQLIYNQKVKPLLPLLSALSIPELTSLNSEIAGFIDRATVGQAQDPLFDPDLPRSITDLLARARLSLKLDALEGLAEKVSFLMTVMTLSQGIIQNSQSKALPDDQSLGRAIAQLLYLHGTDFDFVI